MRVCARCGLADITPVEVDKDGNVLVACADPNCLNRWWIPVGGPEVREAGARLAAARRARIAARTGADFDVMRARTLTRVAEEQASLDLLDLIREAA